MANTRNKRTRRKSMADAGEIGHDPILSRRLSEIRPTPENDDIYGRIDTDDEEIVALAESIRQHGLREPLVVSLDGYILSGHRRYVAAGLAGLHTS